MERRLYQIIDANLNRTKEGLRVCEDIARFMLCDKAAAKSLKAVRHSVTNALLKSKKMLFKRLLKARDTNSDILKCVDFPRNKNAFSRDIFMANIQRAKESLRVLEECSKVIDEDLSQRYRQLRFKIYDIEKKTVIRP